MKQNRHQKIAELVSRYEIETQEELAEKLKEAGFTVTQATISRDIRLCIDGYGAEYFGHADGFRNGDGSGGCAGCHSFRGSGRLYRRR